MKLKDILTITTNSNNNQSIWNPRKRKIKKKGLTEEDILNIDLGEYL